MKTIRINDPSQIEMVEVNLKNFPIAFKNKVEELMEDCGLSKEEAEKEAAEMVIELELYYHKGCGLFGVEKDAVESSLSGGLCSPYDNSVELYEEEEF